MNRLVALCVLLLCILGHNGLLYAANSSGQAKPATARAWSRGQMEALFPAPLSGWTAGDVKIKKYDHPTQKLFGAMVGMKALHVVYDLFRQYQHGSLVLGITITTYYLGLKNVIDKAHDDQEIRAELASEGVSPTTVKGQRAISISRKNEKGYGIKLGTGTLVIECTGLDCGDAAERYLTRMDLQRIIEFVEFPHERAPESANQP